MASKPSKLTVNYTALARRNLAEIWLWNADAHSEDHADKYIRFLRAEADKLAATHSQGSPVPTRQGYQYVIIKRKQKGHGHIAVYTITRTTVEILAFYHTRQDWQGRIERGEL